MGLVFMEFGNLGSYKFGIHAKAVKTNIYILPRSFVNYCSHFQATNL